MANVYEIITDKIIAELEKGNIPWHKPWTGSRSGAYSRATGKAYSFINQMLLKNKGEYLTFKECQKEGGKIKKGEKSEMVVFYTRLEIDEKDKDNKLTGDKKTIPYLKYINVFHISQCEGIELKYKEEDKPIEKIHHIDKLVDSYLIKENIKLNYVKGDKACYSPTTDIITLPLIEQFKDIKEHYSTLFHEMVHSTGHSSRLNRITKLASFGSETYSKEELVAEIGATQLLTITDIGIDKVFKNNIAYIQSWIKALKNDKNMIVSAAGKAEKAVKLILNEQD